MSFYSDTPRFVKACAKIIERLAQMPDAVTKSSYVTPDVLANARAILAASKAASAAAESVIEQMTPKPKPPEIHNHYPIPRPSAPFDGPTMTRSTGTEIPSRS